MRASKLPPEGDGLMSTYVVAEHLAEYAGEESEALVFTADKGGGAFGQLQAAVGWAAALRAARR